MWPSITVDPTKLNPRRFRSRLNAPDSRVVAPVFLLHSWAFFTAAVIFGGSG